METSNHQSVEGGLIQDLDALELLPDLEDDSQRTVLLRGIDLKKGPCSIIEIEQTFIFT